MHSPRSSSTEAEHVAISRSRGVTIDWKDGHHSEYGLAYLRERCPCATCTGAHGSEPATPSPFHMYASALKIVDVNPVGSYAMQIRWSDQHDSGIYAYEYLRRICPCDECSGGQGDAWPLQ